MTLEEWVGKGWAEHGEDPKGVFARMPEGIALVTEAKHVGPLAGLLVHVAAEHLGRYDDGLSLLDRLGKAPGVAPGSIEERAIARSKATLHFARGDRASAEAMLARAAKGSAFPAASDRVRALAIAGSALTTFGKPAEGGALLEEAIETASYGPTKDDPAARALAVTGNNLACELEKKAKRTPAETELMLRAAQLGRRWWEVVGTHVEVGRAEYRLAMSSLAAGDADDALRHGRAALELAHGDPADAFGGHDALARALLARGDVSGAQRQRDEAVGCLERIEDPHMRSGCEDDLATLDAALSSATAAASTPRSSTPQGRRYRAP